MLSKVGVRKAAQRSCRKSRWNNHKSLELDVDEKLTRSGKEWWKYKNPGIKDDLMSLTFFLN